MHISNIFDSNRLLETLIRHFSIYKYEYRLLGYSRVTLGVGSKYF